MVTIPQGNYDNQKIIIGKALDNNDIPMIYKSPFQQLVNVSNNLINRDVGTTSYWANYTDGYMGRYWNVNTEGFKNSTVYTYFKNEGEPTSCIWDSGDIFERGFTRLGIQAQFSTWLGEYSTFSGNYGLAVELTFKCFSTEENYKTFTNTLTFDSSEFFGDVYNFESYYTQENLYDISDFIDYPIIRIRLFPYQRGNFVNTSGEPIYELLNENDFSNIGPNIFVKDPYICLGISTEEFSNDTISLITDSSLFYYKHIPSENYENNLNNRIDNNRKVINARWLHKDIVTNTIKTVEQDEFPIDYELRWYRYKLGAPSPDEFAGAHWQRLYACGAQQDEIGEWFLPEYLEIHDLSDTNISTYYIYQNDQYIETTLIQQDLTTGVLYDEEHGGFKKDNSDEYVKLYIKTEDNMTNTLEVVFQPNINNETEKIKAIVLKRENIEVQRIVAISDILTFTNNDDVRSQATLIDANALSIRYEDDEKGHYFLYNRAGDIGKEEYGEVRVLTAVFDEGTNNINEKALLNLNECTSVIWNFPDESTNTMIVPMTGTGADATPAAALNGEYSFSNVQQVGYTIKRHLNNNANQNTVKLTIVKDGLEYTAQTQMTFGTAGTSGSDYTLFVEWEDGRNAVNLSSDFLSEHELKGYVYLMDSAGQIIDIPPEAELSLDWMAASSPEIRSYPVTEIGKLYPVRNNAFGQVTNTSITYSFDIVENSNNNLENKLYEYDLEDKQFKEVNNDDGNKILYQQHFEPITKIEFVPIETVDDGYEQGKIITTNSKRVFHYGNNKQRLFVKYNDTFIIDPWDSYQETETYYEPVSTKEVVYKNDCPLKHSCQKDSITGLYEISVGCTGRENEDTHYSHVNINSLYILQITLSNFGDYDLITQYPIPLKNGECKKFIKTEDTNINNEKQYYIYQDSKYIKYSPSELEDLENCYESITNDNEKFQKNFVVDYIEGPTSVRYATTGETDFNKNPYEIIVRQFEDGNWIKKTDNPKILEYREEENSSEPGEEPEENPSEPEEQQPINQIHGYWKLLYYFTDDDQLETVKSQANFLPSLAEQRIDEIDENTNEVKYKTFSSIYQQQYFRALEYQNNVSYYNNIYGIGEPINNISSEDFNNNIYYYKVFEKEDYQFTNSPILAPLGVYFKDAPLYGVQFILNEDILDEYENIIVPNGTVLWTQPILVYQDNYPSTTLNKWNGKDILTDNDTGVIVANGLSAGKKESDNTFTGVVMGDWSRTDTDAFITKQTGVYGFNHGAMSYALKDDGTAFFGKDGRGRIYFNGNKAQIYSSHWIANKNEKNGMLIDVDDGYIKIISNDFKGSNNNKTRAKITLSGSSPYFEIKDIEDNYLINIGSNSYYLQSGNYSIENTQGIKFDLKEGSLEGYNLRIRAKRTATDTYSPVYTNKYKKSYSDGSWTEETRSKDSINSNSAIVTLDSSQRDFPFKIGNNFKVSWGGCLEASQATVDGLSADDIRADNIKVSRLTAYTGEIGGWTLNTVSIQGGSTQLHSSNGITTNLIKIRSGLGEDGTDVGTLGYVESGLPSESGGGTPGIGFSSSNAIFKATGANAGFSCGGAYVSANKGDESSSVSIGGTRINLQSDDVEIQGTDLEDYIRSIVSGMSVSVWGTDSNDVYIYLSGEID